MKTLPMAVMAVLAIGLTACTSSTAGTHPPATRASTPPTTATTPATGTGSATSSSPAAPSGGAATSPAGPGSIGSTGSALAQCADAAFAVSATDAQGATGHSSVVLQFRNIMTRPCTVRGYPGVDALTSTGAVLAHATRTLNGFAGGAHTVATLTVAPGAIVSAVLEWMNFNPSTSGTCASSTTIAVTPANTTHTVHLPVRTTACVLQIHPTVAGTTGSQ